MLLIGNQICSGIGGHPPIVHEMRIFELRELRQLLGIDEFCHFSRATKAVGLSQPALTESLARIEHVLGRRSWSGRARMVPMPLGKEVPARRRGRQFAIALF